MLVGEIPAGLDGIRYATREDWFRDHLEIIRGQAEAETGETSGPKFNGAFRSCLMRYWRHKRPRARASPTRGPGKLERMAEILRQFEEGECVEQAASGENPGTPDGGEPGLRADALWNARR